MMPIKNSIVLTFLSLSILVGCSSGKVVDHGNNSIPEKQVEQRTMNNNLRKGKLAMGDVLQPYLFNDYQIAGMDISKTDKARSDAFDALLSELGLVRIEDSFQRGMPPVFISFKRKDNKPFLTENDLCLEQLRARFGDSFGPVVISESGILQGALQHQMIVKFK